MRIHAIRFKNLNSLVGEWEIDFTHPAFNVDGIFAITGATGAGKTSILDAICLALYGRTPRLAKITQSENEIMARQTGECFAELVFETKAGHFRCHWSQWRARKKSDGELQAPKHEIVCMRTNQVLESKLREVANRVEVVSGMNFERFTQSMLLAQGGFAVFLQASPDRRAPILEQITGTEIYSKISICIHERRSDEYKKLMLMQAHLASLNVLSIPAEEQLKLSLIKYRHDLDVLSQEIAHKNLALDWLNMLASIKRELCAYNVLQHELLAEIDVLKPWQERLEKANLALELAGEYAVLITRRQEQARLYQECTEIERLLPALKLEHKEASAATLILSEGLIRQQKQYDLFLAIAHKVREFDTKLLEKSKALQEVMGDFKLLEQECAELSLEYDAIKLKFDAAQVDLQKTRIALTANKVNSALIEQFAGIAQRFESVRELYLSQDAKRVELDLVIIEQEHAIRSWQQHTNALQAKVLDCKHLSDILAQHKQGLELILLGRSLNDWRHELVSTKARQQLLNALALELEAFRNNELLLDRLKLRITIIVFERTNLNSALALVLKQLEDLLQEQDRLEIECRVFKQKLGFNEARSELKSDAPCPLCGSVIHPYVGANLVVITTDEDALAVTRCDLDKARELQLELKIKCAENNKDLTQALFEQDLLLQRLALARAELESKNLVLDDDCTHKLMHSLQEHNKILIKLEITVQDGEEYENTIKAADNAYTIARAETHSLEQDLQRAWHQKEARIYDFARSTQELSKVELQLQKMEVDIYAELSVYGVYELSATSIDAISSDLSARRKNWILLEHKAHELAAATKILALELDFKSKQNDELALRLYNKNIMHMNLDAIYQDLSTQRASLFGDKSPDDENIRLSLALTDKTKALESMHETTVALERKLLGLNTELSTLEKARALLLGQLEQNEREFKVQIFKFNFVDEAQYRNACLDETDRRSLIDKFKRLDEECIRLSSLISDKTKLLIVTEEKQLSFQSVEQLEQDLIDLNSKSSLCLQQILSIENELKLHELMLGEQQKQIDAMELQRLEFVRWDMLHALIGSADGKKYRNFAQGLSFEIMLNYANQHLLKMSDRYLLLRVKNEPLELNVIDAYQAGELRSTKNLSGGEAFIISLALALGLANMASKNVCVDSLFLDEGFGTLDEDALDIALDTLASLHQSGKLIGVISHVPALKLRINTQIQLHAKIGGNSAITGPGCRRLD